MTAALSPTTDGPAGAGWAGTYVLTNSTRSPALARMLVRQALLSCPPATVESAELLVSELVTNAVRHAETDILLHVSLHPRLLVSVEDTSADPIREPLLGGDDDSGRGLAIVDAVASAWGWEWTLCGKRTWFEL